MALRSFEESIIEDFRKFAKPEIGIVRGGKSVPRKGVWIRGHLLDVREDFVYSMWKKWRSFTEIAHNLGAPIEVGTYTAFRTYVYLLKRAGLLIPIRRERAKTTTRAFFKQYYTVNRAMLNDPRWLNPYAAYASWQEQKRKGFEKPKKKPKVPVVPPRVPVLTRKEYDRIWAAAEKFLREHGYTITRERLEEFIPDWMLEVTEYETFKERVGYVIHECVELEEVYRMARRWMDPRMAPEAVGLRAHEIATRMEKLWLGMEGE
jgi:hypothetical protein